MPVGVYKHKPHQGFQKGHKLTPPRGHWKKSGKNHPNWKGGITKTNEGYILEFHPNHPFAWKSGYILQHRLIMEKYIKRFLLPIEVVHHINGISNDNRIENLQLLSGYGEHNSIHKTKRR